MPHKNVHCNFLSFYLFFHLACIYHLITLFPVMEDENLACLIFDYICIHPISYIYKNFGTGIHHVGIATTFFLAYQSSYLHNWFFKFYFYFMSSIFLFGLSILHRSSATAFCFCCVKFPLFIIILIVFTHALVEPIL